jgi:proline racemase
VGNVYVADAGNHTIRKVTLSGVVTTLAGSGALGSLDGRGPEAQFNAPQAVAVDAAGNVYVADTGNHVLRVISPDGLVATLAHLGRIRPGELHLDTCVGRVSARLADGGTVTLTNVASYRARKAVTVDVPGLGPVTGDVAWGGNWFFLVGEHPWALDLRNVELLTDVTWRIRQAVNKQGFPEVDHVELFGLPGAGGDSRNFVLCPGKAYDRSPCGTGTSAKLACLAADGKLAEGEDWIQESILGSTFTGRFRWRDRTKGEIEPIIAGTAHVNSEATLLLDERDPFCWGIR